MPDAYGTIEEAQEKLKLNKDIMLQLAFIEKKRTLSSFEEIGLIDPQGDLEKTEKVINNMQSMKKVYPEALMKSNRPPKCIFIPNK